MGTGFYFWKSETGTVLYWVFFFFSTTVRSLYFESTLVSTETSLFQLLLIPSLSSWTLGQRSPNSLMSGTRCVEDNFFYGVGEMVSGLFKYIVIIVHFTSRLMLWLISQEVLVLSPEVGGPYSRSPLQ